MFRRYVTIAVHAAALSALASAAPVATAQRVHPYQVTIDSGLTTLSVRACFDGESPDRLIAAQRAAGDVVHEVEAVSPKRSRGLSVSGRRINTASMKSNECVEYKVDLKALESRSGQTSVSRFGNSLVTLAGEWLWRPAGRTPDEDIELRFILPEGIEVSAPWTPVGSPDERRYRVGRTPSSWPARVAFGPFLKTVEAVGNSTLRIAVLSDGRPVDNADVSTWLLEAAQAVAGLYGRFPVPTVQVLVIGAADGDGPVPWGQISRGGSPAALFIINPDRPLAELRADWTAAHELSHLLLPYVSRRQAWLSEGFASYYQNIARSRAGLLNEQQVWQNLYDGFGRGLAGTRNETLSEATRSMREGNNYMRVYWSGVAMALKADIELRRLSGGRQTLADALRELGECCLPSSRLWTGQEVFGQLDRITDTEVFMTLYDSYVYARQFPDLSQAWQLLGIRNDGDRVILAGDEEQIALRNAIASPHDNIRVAAD